MDKYYKRKEEGVCPQCGQRPPAEGITWCLECRSAFNQRLKAYPLEMQRKWDKSARIRVFAETIRAYGGVCVCCGERHLPFLQLDHINGGGLAHRKEIGGAGSVFYSKLKKAGFPKENLQVLCANCHTAKSRSIPCPEGHNVDIRGNREDYPDMKNKKERNHRDVIRGG